MKKLILSNLIIFTFFVFYFSKVSAQISKGGTPLAIELQLNNYINKINLPEVDTNVLLTEDSINSNNKSIPYRFGFNHFTNINVKNSATITNLNGTAKLYQLAIYCPGALSINLAFDQFNIPRGAKMFIYNEQKTHILGAFDNSNVQEDKFLGCDLLPGNTCIIEYFEPINAEFSGELTIFRVTHGYRNLFSYLMKSYGDAGSCNVNINCPIALDWEQQKRSVACIVVNGNESCTGALVNNTLNDGRPYFLTANHCLGGSISTWVFRFNWESPTCSNQNGPTNQSISGAVLRARSAATDFALLELNSTPPQNYGVFYSGWNREGFIVDSSFCIHHPSGDIKKFSVAANPTISSSYSGADCWRVGQWTLAVTEPGSSGSPLFDPNKRIIGQLYGGPSFCNANEPDLNDYYGKFSSSWTGGGTNSTRLSNWLDPSNSGVLVLDGYDTNMPLSANDVSLIQILNSSSTLTCTNFFVPEIRIKSLGSSPLENFTYSIFVNDIFQFSAQATLNSPLNFQQTSNVQLNQINNIPAGSNTIRIELSLPNALTDGNESNNSISTNFNVFNSASSINSLLENFENSNSTNENWNIIDLNNNAKWRKYEGAGGFGLSGNSFVKNNFFADSAAAGDLDYLISNKLNFDSSLLKNYLYFSYAYTRKSQRNDTLKVLYTNNCGQTWNTLWNKGGNQLSTTGMTMNVNFIPTTEQWKRDSINLSSLIGENEVQFAFLSKSGAGNNVYLDDVNIVTDLVGIEEINLAKKLFSVFPNPSHNGLLSINFLQFFSNNFQIRILNILGQEIFNSTINFNSSEVYSLQLPNSPKGIFWVEITIENKKFIEKFALN